LLPLTESKVILDGRKLTLIERKVTHIEREVAPAGSTTQARA